MPDIASVLKAEIVRLARKELKAQTDGFKKSLATYREDVSALRKRVAALESELKRANRAVVSKKAAVAVPSESTNDDGRLRFRAAGMANNRKRLELSAADFGLLVGTTGQTIYAWESGRAKPRAHHLAAIAALRGLGKREVAAKLQALK